MTDRLRAEINDAIIAAQLELIGGEEGCELEAARHLLRAWSGCMEIAAPERRGERTLRVVKGEGT
jgi:hypothetical protein